MLLLLYMKPKLIIAAAGSGKSTHLVKLLAEVADERVLITTYTDANAEAVEKKTISRLGFIPPNLTIKPWFSFLLHDGVRPYQGGMIDERISNMHFVGMHRSASYTTSNGDFYQIPDTEKEHYIDSRGWIYSDKLSKFTDKVDELHQGAVIKRICKLYKHIFIDEVQDLNGYDLEILRKLAMTCEHLVMVGDVRQVAYRTHTDQKNSQYNNGKIADFFRKVKVARKPVVEIDTESLSTSYRCCSQICDVANKVFPDLPKCSSGNNISTGHDGVFFVTEEDVDEYRELYNPQILRYSDSDKKEDNSINFGASKGLEFERVLIYPTKSIRQWFFDHNTYLKKETRAKLYIALTRARQSVGVVVPSKALKKRNALPLAVWNNEPAQSLFNLFED